MSLLVESTQYWGTTNEGWILERWKQQHLANICQRHLNKKIDSCKYNTWLQISSWEAGSLGASVKRETWTRNGRVRGIISIDC